MTDEYATARRDLNRHLWLYHQQAQGAGTLEERVDQHDDLHWQCAQRGVVIAHEHAELRDDETVMECARRYWQEGVAQEGLRG